MYDFDFARRLQQLREQRGISAREMSLSIGQNPSYINRIENNLAYPSMQGFFYICEYLKLSPRDFFDDRMENPNRLHSLMDKLEQMDSQGLDAVEGVVNALLKGK